MGAAALKSGKVRGRAAGIDLDQFRVRPGRRLRLDQIDTAETGPFGNRKAAEGRLDAGIERLADLQERLYAQNRWSVLLILQAMDAAGKDSTIKHVMRGLNPMGVHVVSFKAPSAEELDHDYLWRSLKALPERGRIGVFNRSHYEEVLVVRVRPELLARQQLPPSLVTDRIWKERYEDICAVERYLSRNGTVIRKCFLHVSKEEQRRRFLERLDNPSKHWKFSIADLEERARWPHYMRAYEEAISATATKEAPWFVVPADHKWFMHLVVAEILVDALESLDLQFPEVSPADRRALVEARARLSDEG
jgi:PPK2 family polyphosphate:nucleotide phosphotransferase